MTHPSETPRTDALIKAMDAAQDPMAYRHHDVTGLARQLERELSAAQSALAQAKKDAEQYRQNWLAFQDMTGAQCMELALPIVQGWKEDSAALALREREAAGQTPQKQIYLAGGRGRLTYNKATHTITDENGVTVLKITADDADMFADAPAPSAGGEGR